jgi:putative ABC transport system permease protein
MRFLKRRRTRGDFSAEIQSHLELETDRLIADGLRPDDARSAALQAFGNVTRVEERFFETTPWSWLEQGIQDLRYAWRGMRRSPSFVLTAVLTLAVGLGLLTVAFTVMNAYVLRPFAIRDPSSLHQIVWHSRDGGGQGFRWRDYEELSRRTDLFTAVIGEHTRIVSSDGRPIMAAVVSLNYFDALGPAILTGRGIGSIDLAGDAAVLTNEAWARLFDRDPAILGRTLDLNGRTFTIVGVVGPQFTGLGDWPRDVFVPVTARLEATERADTSPRRETEITVRLRPGVSIAHAEAALAPFMVRVLGNQPAVRAEVRPQSSPNQLSPELLLVLSPVFAAFVLVLVTACANVSNVMLARAIARDREIAVRLSIGATRGRLIRQMLTEGFLVALLASAAGLMLAWWGLRLALVLLFSTLPPSVAPLMRIAPLTFDARVFVFSAASAVLTTVLCALVPALQASRMSLIDALRGHGGGGRRGSRLRNMLVVAQVGVAIVLVITAMTLARNGAAVGALDLGFNPEGVMSVNVRGDKNSLARPLAEAFASDPRIEQVAVTSGNPLFNQMLVVAAGPDGGGLTKRTPLTFVSPEFFQILRVPIARGRGFGLDEARSAARVAIVSEATARAFWPGEDPVGKVVRIERAGGRPVDEVPGYSDVTVVGTVRDVVSGLLINGRDAGHIYLPMTSADTHATAMLVRPRANRELSPEISDEIFRRVAPDPQVFEILPLGEMRDLQMYPLSAASWIAWLLGGVALVLSVSGLYGVLTYALSQRRKEIGIRLALGSTARGVAALVVRQSMRLAGIGAAIGVAVTFVALGALNAAVHLAALSLVDAGAFAAALLLILAITAVAAYGPARRASRVDPCQALRSDA